jgi:hypothetical protein
MICCVKTSVVSFMEFVCEDAGNSVTQYILPYWYRCWMT